MLIVLVQECPKSRTKTQSVTKIQGVAKTQGETKLHSEVVGTF